MTQFHPTTPTSMPALPQFSEVRFASLSEAMDRPSSFDPLFFKLIAPDLFRGDEAGAIVREALNLAPGTPAKLRVKIQPRFFAGHSRTTACAEVEAVCGSQKVVGRFAIKLLTGCEKRSDPILAGVEVDLSRAYRREPLFRKHFAASFGIAAVDTSDEIREKITIEHGLHPIAVPPRAIVQFNQWIRGVSLESAVVAYLNSRTQKEICGAVARDELIAFGSRVLDIVNLSWARLSSDTGGVLFDLGSGDILLSPQPGTRHLTRTHLLKTGDPVFVDPDGGLRCGGVESLDTSKRELLSTLHFAILSPARAGQNPSMFGELSEKVQQELVRRFL